MKDMKVVAMIQARMGSTRLPGKVLKKIEGKPLLSYELTRLKQSKRIDKIVLLTTTNHEDKALVQFAMREKIACFRGSEEDVLKRFKDALEEHPAEAIVRITGDCPFIDPTIVDTLIDTFIQGNYDYVHTGQSFPEGADTEIISAEALRNIDRKADKKYQREHVTQYIHDHKEDFLTKTVELEQKLGEYRLSVDEPEDFEAISRIISLLGEQAKTASMREVIDILNAHPDVKALNHHIIRNEGLIKSKQAEEEQE